MSASASVLHLVNAVPGTIVRLGSKKLSRLHHHQERCFRGVVSTGKHLKQLLLASSELGVSCRLRNRRVLVTEAMTSVTLSKKQAQDLAVKLTPDERDVLISALQECQSRKTKAEYEGQLAAFRWRSKFGRPSRVPSLGDVDPTGSYCAVPDDWLLRKYVETVPQPSRRDLMRVSVANAIPFIGFGFLDNFIMIIAGDQIETSLGAIISLSTMAAAAFGNTISDILGIGSAYYVELLAQKIGFQPPKLTPIQLDMPKSRRAANMGRVIGITIGCLLGMMPLLFLHQEHKDKNQDNEEKAPESKSK